MKINYLKPTLLCALLILTPGCGGIRTASNGNKITNNNASTQIILNGENPMRIHEGEEYIDPGATSPEKAKSTSNIIVGGDKVDSNTVGTYTVTYDMNDSLGNTDTATRTVIVDTIENKTFTTPSTTKNINLTSKLQTIRDLLQEAKNGTKKVFLSIAGDSKRDDAVAQEEIFYSMWLKQVGVTYGHTAITSIESDAWITDQKGLPRLVKLSNLISDNGANSIIGIELGTNDINHESIRNRDSQHLYNFTLDRLTKLILSIKKQLPDAHLYLTEPALISQPQLKLVYKQLSLNFDIPLVDSVLDNKMPSNKRLRWFKDEIHPLYSGSLRSMMNDFETIMPDESIGILRKYTTQNNFSNIPDTKVGINLAKGIPVNNYSYLLDTQKTPEGATFKSVTVPVIGGSIIKLMSNESILLNYHKALGANGKGILNNGDDFARSNISFGTLGTAYKFIYVPKNTTSICFNYATDTSMSAIKSNPLDIRYVSKVEMKNHPNMPEIVQGIRRSK